MMMMLRSWLQGPGVCQSGLGSSSANITFSSCSSYCSSWWCSPRLRPWPRWPPVVSPRHSVPHTTSPPCTPPPPPPVSWPRTRPASAVLSISSHVSLTSHSPSPAVTSHCRYQERSPSPGRQPARLRVSPPVRHLHSQPRRLRRDEWGKWWTNWPHNVFSIIWVVLGS